MKKPDRKEFFRDFQASLQVVSAQMPGLLPVTILKALLNAAYPFVGIILGAQILDRGPRRWEMKTPVLSAISRAYLW